MTQATPDTLSPEVLAQLEQLRDIHLPAQIGWWPLAPGWWGLMALALIVLVATLVWMRLRRFTTRALALRELEAIPADDPITFATKLSVLLRRVAIRKDASAGQLQDTGWVDFLTKGGMSADMASHLALAPYAAPLPDSPSADALRQAAAQWIKRTA